MIFVFSHLPVAVRQANIKTVHDVCEGRVVLDKEREKEGDIVTFLWRLDSPTLRPSITCVKGAWVYTHLSVTISPFLA